IHCVFGRLEGDLWKFKIFNNSTNGTTVIMELNSSSPITDFNASGPPPPGEETRDLLLVNQGGFAFTESSDPAFGLMEHSISVTSGDFDNDMDNDVIVMATGRA